MAHRTAVRLAVAAIIAATTVMVFSATARSPKAESLPANEHVVRIDPKNVKVQPVVLAKGGEPFPAAIRQLKPCAAINGTYYDRDYKPEGDIVAGGKLLNKGKYPSAFVVSKSGKASIVWRKDASFGSSGYKAVLAAGPRLIRDGKVKIDPTADGFSMRALEIVAPRSGVGVTEDGTIVLAVDLNPVKLADFAERMRKLGCVQAMNLDGGPACGLYYQDRTLAEATLPMTNMLVFYKKP